jgi:hypothetical protein
VQRLQRAPGYPLRGVTLVTCIVCRNRVPQHTVTAAFCQPIVISSGKFRCRFLPLNVTRTSLESVKPPFLLGRQRGPREIADRNTAMTVFRGRTERTRRKHQ